MSLRLILLIATFLLISGFIEGGKILDRLREQQQLPYKYHYGSLKRRGDESEAVANFREALAAQMEYTKFKYNCKEGDQEQK
ncbi:hypothetical protein K7432_012826 [Basidiobolus ranarum]|uniref:Uncharacterized protein n=1 Tax=Basidiobolus ranarum TaxID=34480 RepID=A0ABR2WKD1_9FUNG